MDKQLEEVKRYRWHEDGMWCFEPGEVRTTAQWVRAEDYDRLTLALAEARELVREAVHGSFEERQSRECWRRLHEFVGVDTSKPCGVCGTDFASLLAGQGGEKA